MTPLQQLIGHLTPEEQAEFTDAIDYLTEMSDRPRPPEGSISSILNSLSPNVRSVFRTLEQLSETPRLAPFQEKMTPEQYDETLGLDPQVAGQIRQRRFDEDITSGLQQRMGTDSNRPAEPLDRRDHIRAAVEAHRGE